MTDGQTLCRSQYLSSCLTVRSSPCYHKNCTIQQTNSEILKTLGREKTVLFLQSVKILIFSTSHNLRYCITSIKCVFNGGLRAFDPPTGPTWDKLTLYSVLALLKTLHKLLIAGVIHTIQISVVKPWLNKIPTPSLLQHYHSIDSESSFIFMKIKGFWIHVTC